MAQIAFASATSTRAGEKNRSHFPAHGGRSATHCSHGTKRTDRHKLHVGPARCSPPNGRWLPVAWGEVVDAGPPGSAQPPDPRRSAASSGGRRLPERARPYAARPSPASRRRCRHTARRGAGGASDPRQRRRDQSLLPGPLRRPAHEPVRGAVIARVDHVVLAALRLRVTDEQRHCSPVAELGDQARRVRVREPARRRVLPIQRLPQLTAEPPGRASRPQRAGYVAELSVDR